RVPAGLDPAAPQTAARPVPRLRSRNFLTEITDCLLLFLSSLHYKEQPRRAECERLPVERAERARLDETGLVAQGKQLVQTVDPIEGAACLHGALAQKSVVGAEDAAGRIVLALREEPDRSELCPSIRQKMRKDRLGSQSRVEDESSARLQGAGDRSQEGSVASVVEIAETVAEAVGGVKDVLPRQVAHVALVELGLQPLRRRP